MLSLVFGGLGLPELLIILFILVLLFGARRLPELARGLGQSVRSFKEGISTEGKKLEDKSSTPEETERL
jgi:sec-independent protein translocase protein TatA